MTIKYIKDVIIFPKQEKSRNYHMSIKVNLTQYSSYLIRMKEVKKKTNRCY